MAQSDFVSRGQALVAAGQYQEAVKVCRLGLLARPGEVSGRLILGQALMALRRYDEVLAEMRVAIEVDAHNAGARQLKGEALLRKGDGFAAVEELERARELAPSDADIAGLLAEARLDLATDGARATGPSFGDYGDSLTKHYPAHRGGDAGGTGRSGSFTKPLAADLAPRAGDRPQTPSPAVLAVGDRSGTVELDPDIEGVQIVDDDLIDPPIGPPIDPPLGPPIGIDPTSTLDVVDDDLMEVADAELVDVFEVVPDLDSDPTGRGPAAPAPADGFDEETRAERPRSRSTAPPVGRARRASQEPAPRARRASQEPASRPRRASQEPARVRRPSQAPRPPGEQTSDSTAQWRADEVSEAMTRQKHLPDALRDPAEQATVPRPLVEAEPAPVGLDPNLARSAAAIDDLFPDEDSRSPRPHPRLGSLPAGPLGAGPAPPASGPHAPTVAGVADRAPPSTSGPPVPRLAPEALTMVPFTAASVRPTADLDAQQPPGGGDPTGVVVDPAPSRAAPSLPSPADLVRPPPRAAGRGRAAPRPGRRPWAIALWSILTVVIVGAGVLAGFWIRDLRLARQIAGARKGADSAAHADTWMGWRNARDRLVGVTRARGGGEYRALLARARAVLAADFVDDVDGARGAVAALGSGGGKDGALARAYLALADGDPGKARQAVGELGAPDDPAVALINARAALLDARWDDAAVAARASADRDPRPAAWLALCQAELGRRHFSDGEKACDQALEAVPGHPGAVITRARIQARAGVTRDQVDGLVAALEELVSESQRPLAEQSLGVSPAQAAWAQLTVAEIRVAAGDTIAARRALERSQGGRVDSRGFVEAEAALLVALGDLGPARAAADAGLTRWKRSVPLALVRARALLVAGDLTGAAEVLDGVGAAVSTSPDALLVRGEVALARGDLDAAARDLDAVLARSPELEDAVVARAEVDVARSDGTAALARLEPRWNARPRPRLAIAYAAARRSLNQLDEARAALAPITAGPASPVAGHAWLELARVERDAGQFAAARTAYGKAAEMLPAARDALLESGLLAIDDGDAAGGRDTLVGLAATTGDGNVYVEAARAQILTGQLDAAERSLAAAEAAGASRVRLSRERGRLALRRRDPQAAVSGLIVAVDGNPDDLEGRLLLMDAHFASGNEAAARRVYDDMKRLYPGRPETKLAFGRQELQAQRFREARAAFGSAVDALAKAPRRQRAEATYWLGFATYFTDDLPRARRLLLDAVKLDPGVADAQAVLGMVAAEMGDWSGAVAAYQQATTLDPGNVEAYFFYGQALAQLRRAKPAREWLQKYVDADPQGDHVEDARAILAAGGLIPRRRR